MTAGDSRSNATADAQAKNEIRISDEALVRSIAAGNRIALKVLYARHHARLYRFLQRMVDDATAEDVLNEVFLQVWRRAEQFQGQSQVATWLMAIARFTAISHCRRRADLQLDERAAAFIEDTADSPAASMDKRERSAVLQKCLAKLTPHHREVIDLIYYQGKKIEEVARFIGAPVNTIKTRMHHARNRMALLLAEAGVDRTWVAI